MSFLLVKNSAGEFTPTELRLGDRLRTRGLLGRFYVWRPKPAQGEVLAWGRRLWMQPNPGVPPTVALSLPPPRKGMDEILLLQHTYAALQTVDWREDWHNAFAFHGIVFERRIEYVAAARKK